MRSIPVVLLALLAATGCSKKEAKTEAPTEAAAEVQPKAKAAGADDGAFDPSVAAGVAATAAAKKAGAAAGESAKNWDSVVAEIVQLRRPPMTDEKRVKMLALQDELSDATKTDAAAREAYQNLSRIINGR